MRLGTASCVGTAIAAYAALSLAVQSCGVMVSEECAEKAICQESGTLGADATDLDGSSGDDLTAAADNEASETNVSEDVGAVDADAGDAFTGDVVTDVVAEDVLTLADGCAAPDMCGTVPTGWQAALFWIGDSGAPVPSCPGDTQNVDLKAGFTAGGPDTCGCTCTLSDTCTAKATFHPDQGCGLPTCIVDGGGMAAIGVTPSPSGACTAVPDNLCGSGGSLDTPPLARVIYDAGCVPTPTVTPGSASTWMTAARLCARPVASGVCSANQQCVPSLTSDFTKVCIYQAGDTSCPALPSPYQTKIQPPLYGGANDTRGCSPCTCGNPSTGMCGGSLVAYGSRDCSGASFTYSFALASCQAYLGFTLNPNPGSIKANYTVTHGTCPTPAATQPEGGVTAAAPTTVCCM
jgi:hypothetical protein